MAHRRRMGLVVAMAGLGVAVLVSAGLAAEGAGERQTVTTETAARPGIPLWGTRAVLIVAGLGGWFWTHYTMDVFAGAVTALLAAGLASELAPACDRVLAIVAHAFGG